MARFVFAPVGAQTNELQLALAYLDDRAVRFTGDWPRALAELDTPPWWDKPLPPEKGTDRD